MVAALRLICGRFLLALSAISSITLALGCGSSSGDGGDSPTTGSAVLRASVDVDVMELTSAPSSRAEVNRDDFALFSRDIRYEQDSRAVVMELVVVNESVRRFFEPVILTFASLAPEGVLVLNPDNDENGPGASVRFDFANGDGVWTQGEQSLSREIRFGVPEGTTIAFVARIDAGFDSLLGAIGGLVWLDEDGDGIMESDEEGLRGVTIELRSSGTHIGATETDGDGAYRFEDLEPGLYEVNKFESDAFESTTSTLIDVVLVENEGQVGSFLAANFGCRRAQGELSGAIGGLVWNDGDEDGEIDGREEGIPGVRLGLTGERIRDRFIRTDVAGEYRFDGLVAGSYTVTKFPLDGFVPTTSRILRVTLGETDRGVVDQFLEAHFGCTAGEEEGEVCLCHRPPGNPSNEHTICVGAPAVSAHLGHGDSLGPCGSRERVCDDGIDNDDDRLVDCLDSDCFGTSACDGVRAEICDDRIDNDGDRLVDCQDPECAGLLGPRGQVCQRDETICNDGYDNDGDGDIDLDDPTCVTSLPTVVVENGVSIRLPADVFRQDLVVRGNDFTLIGESGNACGDQRGWSVLDGDVLVQGNAATFLHVYFRGRVEVRGNSAAFLSCCFENEPIVFGEDIRIDD